MGAPAAMKVLGPVHSARLHTDIMVGGKQLAPNVSAEHGKDGWLVLVAKDPDGKPDPDHIWIGYDGAWTRVHDSNVRYVRYWRPGDEDHALGGGATLMPKMVRDALIKRGDLVPAKEGQVA